LDQDASSRDEQLRIEMLTRFGLTRNQARVYLAALQLASATPVEVSKASGVHREDVYRLLPKLAEMGLIEVVPGSPVRIRTIPIEEALSAIIGHKKADVENELQQLEETKKNLLDSLSMIKVIANFKENGSHYALISRGSGVTSRFSTMIRSASNDIEFIEDVREVARFLYFQEAYLKEAEEKGVRFHIIAVVNNQDEMVPEIMIKCTSRAASVALVHDPNIKSRYLIIDGREALILKSDSAGKKSEEDSLLWTNDTTILNVVTRDFEHIWNDVKGWTNSRNLMPMPGV
jgi:sugar-specific transcriptional regulator TrmB